MFSRCNSRSHKSNFTLKATVFFVFFLLLDLFCSNWGSKVRGFDGVRLQLYLKALQSLPWRVWRKCASSWLICVCLWVQVCKRKCSEVQRCTPCKQPRCAFAAPDGGLENGGVGGGGGEATSNSETGHCHLPLCPLPSSSASSSSASSSSSSPADGCCGLGLHADLPHSSDSSPCCLHHYDDCQARSSDAADHLSINHLPSSILLKVRVHPRV